MTGARKFLIAYNVNLFSTKEQAHRIALNVRETGRGENEVSRLKIQSTFILFIVLFIVPNTLLHAAWPIEVCESSWLVLR